MKNKLTVFLTVVLMSFSTSAFAFEGFSLGATYSSIDYSTSGKETHANGTAALSTITSTTKNGSICSKVTRKSLSPINLLD